MVAIAEGANARYLPCRERRQAFVNGAMAAGPKSREARRALKRWAIDLAVLVTTGLFLGFLGPFDSDRAALGQRYLYWIASVVGGGLIGIGIDEALKRILRQPWRRMLIVTVCATPVVTAYVLCLQWALFDQKITLAANLWLVWQVLPILIGLMSLRTLVWRSGRVVLQTRTIVAEPLPEAEAALRRRLSAKRRKARLIAIEAHDHFLRVHTDAGVELLALRFSDALKELSLAHGWQIHRSWWVAADAIEAVRWSRGGGELHLLGGLKAPVSRTYRPRLKEAGWF